MSHKIGLALGGGGSRGLAHIGAIKALLENDIEIESIVGTSAGALIGGIYSATKNIKFIEDLVTDLNYSRLAGVVAGFPVTGGLIDGKRVEEYIEKNVGKYDIEKLPLKFAAVSADIISGKKYVFDSGPLSTAIRASVSIPGIFSPLKIGQQLLVDGGVVEPVPIVTLKEKFSPSKTVAVGLYSSIFPRLKKETYNLARVTYLGAQLTLVTLARKGIVEADISILPPVEDINPLDFVKAKEFIDIGYKSTIEKIPEIKKLTSFWSILR